MCGGKGLRLRPVTNDVPKPLIKIQNKPILYYIINHLRKYKIKNFIIATGYKSKKIEDFMKRTFKNLHYQIVNSGNASILTRIKDCLNNINNDFILCYGDTITNLNLDNLIRHHKRFSNSVTISSYPIELPYGVMEINKSSFVKSFNEKPVLNDVMNIGYYYFNKDSHSIIKKEKSLIGVINKLIKNKNLTCYKHTGIHITINTLSELEIANKNVKKIYK